MALQVSYREPHLSPVGREQWQITNTAQSLESKGRRPEGQAIPILERDWCPRAAYSFGRVLEMAESSPDSQAYEAKIKERFGRQKEFEFLIPPPPPEMKEVAN